MSLDWSPFRAVPRPRVKPSPAGTLNVPAIGVVRLARPSLDLRGQPFFDVLNSRVTRYGSNKVALGELSELLWHSARQRPAAEAGSRARDHRAYPSAGGIHPVEILVQDIAGQPTYLYRYEPRNHSLIILKNPASLCESLQIEASSCLATRPATLIWLVVVPDRTAAKYENASSLVLRDVGLVLGTIGLTATAMGLWPVPLGVTGEPFVSRDLKWSLPAFGAGGLHVSHAVSPTDGPLLKS